MLTTDKLRAPDLANAMLALLVGGALVVALVGMAYFQARRPRFAVSATRECDHQYSRALTHADSAIVDAQVPATGPQKGWTAQTCGFLRQAGALK